MIQCFKIIAPIIFFITTIPSCQTGKTEQRDCYGIPKLIGYVNDYSNVLSEEEEHELAKSLATIEQELGPQVVILTISTLDGLTIEDYSLRVAECWKLGRKSHNDGLLITVASNDRRMRIEVGYGLEKIIKDEIAKDIIVTEMAPNFRNNDYFEGLQLAISRITELISRV